jgi:hypothetical protein
MWATDARLSDAGRLWWALHDNDSGLLPVLLDGLDNDAGFGSRRPWDEDLWRWDPAVPGDGDLARIISSTFWGDEDDEWEAESRAPFESFPGLAPPQAESLDPADVEAAAVRQEPAWLGLVPSDRMADVPRAVGWFGTSDAFAGEWGGWDGAGAMTGVLRSWEDRFGARVLRMGFASLHLLVERPPTSESESLRVAAELYNLSSEFHTARSFAVRSVRDIAAEVHWSSIWRLWWD